MFYCKWLEVEGNNFREAKKNDPFDQDDKVV